MFRLLHMPRGTTLEKLTFGQILAASDNIIANADAIKVSSYFGLFSLWKLTRLLDLVIGQFSVDIYAHNYFVIILKNSKLYFLLLMLHLCFLK